MTSYFSQFTKFQRCKQKRLFPQVLKLKPWSDKDIFDKLVAAVKFSIYTDGYNWSFWKTGGGWGEVLRRYKPYTPKDKKDKKDEKEGKGGKGKEKEEDKPVKGKGKAPLKGEAKPKGRGMLLWILKICLLFIGNFLLLYYLFIPILSGHFETQDEP